MLWWKATSLLLVVLLLLLLFLFPQVIVLALIFFSSKSFLLLIFSVNQDILLSFSCNLKKKNKLAGPEILTEITFQCLLHWIHFALK